MTDIVGIVDGIKGCTQVYHAAAVVSFSEKRPTCFKEKSMWWEHQTWLMRVLSNKSDIELCFISSTASIGGVEKIMLDESVEYAMDQVNSYYSVTKYLAELEVIRGREEGLNACIVNPSIVLGYGNWNQGSAKILKNGKDGFPFYTDGSNAFVDARDVAKAATILMEHKCFQGRFLCAAWNKKFVDVFTALSAEFGSKPPRIRVAKWMTEVAWRVATVARFFYWNWDNHKRKRLSWIKE